MSRLFLLSILVFLSFSCQKENQISKEVELNAFYRLSIKDLNESISYSKIISAKTTVTQTEAKGESNPTTGSVNESGHHAGDGCSEDDKDFCEHHPEHKKCSILGEKLEFFGSEIVNKSVVITWRALDESNTSSYELERSLDGKNFLPIYKTTPKGVGVRYSYKDSEQK